MVRTLEQVRAFRAGDNETPIVLMGYYNPIYIYGVERFVSDAKAAGVDGLIVVDLPPEDEELCLPAIRAGINFIRLATPTSDDKRLPVLLKNSSGFVYYVSVLGVTGVKSAAAGDVAAVARIKASPLPVMVGFGVKTGEQAAAITAHADGNGSWFGHGERGARFACGRQGDCCHRACRRRLWPIWPLA